MSRGDSITRVCEPSEGRPKAGEFERELLLHANDRGDEARAKLILTDSISSGDPASVGGVLERPLRGVAAPEDN